MALVAICGALGYGAWLALSKPPTREGQTAMKRVAPANDSLGFVSVAGAGVDLEIIGPDGSRTSTLADAPATDRIPNSESEVDCHGAPEPNGRESACTATVHVKTPQAGDYTIVARASSARAVVLSVGWGTVSQIQRGAFDVPVQVARGGATSFSIIVARENVSQRSQPRAGAP
jgi:hypothetical protein